MFKRINIQINSSCTKSMYRVFYHDMYLNSVCNNRVIEKNKNVSCFINGTERENVNIM